MFVLNGVHIRFNTEKQSIFTKDVYMTALREAVLK